MNIRETLAFLWDDPTHETSTMITRWITESRLFHAFVVDNRAKIRKKLRTATTKESLESVLLELEVARHFVADRRCVVEYERYGQGRARSPDLTVTFRDRTVVNLEVTQMQNPDTQTEWEGKLISLVCHKLGQMIPENLNVLVVAPERGSLPIEDVTSTMKRLKLRTERRELELLSHFGFSDAFDFFKQFQRLSGILVWTTQEQELGNGKSLWSNPQGRRRLPTDITSLLLA